MVLININYLYKFVKFCTLLYSNNITCFLNRGAEKKYNWESEKLQRARLENCYWQNINLSTALRYTPIHTSVIYLKTAYSFRCHLCFDPAFLSSNNVRQKYLFAETHSTKVIIIPISFCSQVTSEETIFTLTYLIP